MIRSSHFLASAAVFGAVLCFGRPSSAQSVSDELNRHLSGRWEPYALFQAANVSTPFQPSYSVLRKDSLTAGFGLGVRYIGPFDHQRYSFELSYQQSLGLRSPERNSYILIMPALDAAISVPVFTDVKELSVGASLGYENTRYRISLDGRPSQWHEFLSVRYGILFLWRPLGQAKTIRLRVLKTRKTSFLVKKNPTIIDLGLHIPF